MSLSDDDDSLHDGAPSNNISIDEEKKMCVRLDSV